MTKASGFPGKLEREKGRGYIHSFIQQTRTNPYLVQVQQPVEGRVVSLEVVMVLPKEKPRISLRCSPVWQRLLGLAGCQVLLFLSICLDHISQSPLY